MATEERTLEDWIDKAGCQGAAYATHDVKLAENALSQGDVSLAIQHILKALHHLAEEANETRDDVDMLKDHCSL